MSRRALLLLAVAVAVTLAVGVLWHRSGGRGRGAAEATGEKRKPGAAAVSSSLPETLASALAKLRGGQSGPETLADLRKALLAADPREAIAAIEAFLRTGQDAPTGEKFAVSSGGLTGAPTLRVFLMDLLGQLARKTGSGAADALARATLEQKTTPEEWAISLRNVAWSEPNAAGFLATKMREMLAEPAWTGAPSAGLLESFDVIVYAGDATFLDQLSGLAQGNSLPLQRAALVAMDRLSERDPLSVMEYLNANPDLMAQRPMLRADYFAKADLSQPAQEAALEAYLGRGDVGLDEKTKLIQALASPATFISDNLLTPAPAPVADDAPRLKTVAATLQRWSAANRFPELSGVIKQVSGRL